MIAHAISNGQKTYNGVAFVSKLPAKDCVTDPPALTDTQRRILAADFDGVRVVNLYVPNGSAVGSDKYAYKLNWLIKIKEFIRDELVRYPRFGRVPKVRLRAIVVWFVHENHENHENIKRRYDRRQGWGK